MQTLRLADPETANVYPLPVGGPAPWHAIDGALCLQIDLPTLPAGWIVVPSFAQGAATDYHQWSLHADDAAWTLAPVLARASSDPPSTATAPAIDPQPGTDPRLAESRPAAAPQPVAPPQASMHIDCWHTHAELATPSLRLTLRADRAPDRYLVTVSARPLRLETPAPPRTSAELAVAPPALSQKTAPPEIASSICSPTGVAMVLAHWGTSEPWLDVVAECRDPATGMYGVWPLAIAAAARRGRIGAVEVFADWEAPLAVLARGIPLVTSIRFARDQLPGAPLEQTGGHLVVVHGAAPDAIDVNDPAAADADTVTRRYPAAAFTAAWLGYRGAAYILPP
jgi:hypothetical protein